MSGHYDPYDTGSFENEPAYETPDEQDYTLRREPYPPPTRTELVANFLRFLKTDPNLHKLLSLPPNRLFVRWGREMRKADVDDWAARVALVREATDQVVAEIKKQWPQFGTRSPANNGRSLTSRRSTRSQVTAKPKRRKAVAKR